MQMNKLACSVNLQIIKDLATIVEKEIKSAGGCVWL